VFFLFPLMDTVRRSFYDVRGKNFIGTESYISVINKEAFRLAASNTLKFTAVCIPLLLVVVLRPRYCFVRLNRWENFSKQLFYCRWQFL